MGVFSRGRVELKSPAQLSSMDAAGTILCEGLDAVIAAAAPGKTTGELNKLFADHLTCLLYTSPSPRDS